MEGFLSKVREQSEAFPECADATCATFWTNGKRDPRRFAAARELLAVWLNVVSGRLPSSSPVNLPGLTTATTVSGAIHEIEGILCNPSASSADLKAAEELARALNLNNL